MAGSPSASSLFVQRVVIGVGDMAVSNNAQVILSTYALGSCIGVVAYDSVGKVGGLLHLMLPDAGISAEKAAQQPAMFATTGLPLLFRAMSGLKAERHRVRILVVGGAGMLAGSDPFRIGERNTAMTLEILRAQGLSVTHQQVGGSINRTVHLEVGSGAVDLKTPVGGSQFTLAA
ncbi:MAG: chemotaxis protein CheD [Opitutae bacterium]|nr:chemotaxis protein CheD [Opitutae bacterium]